LFKCITAPAGGARFGKLLRLALDQVENFCNTTRLDAGWHTRASPAGSNNNSCTWLVHKLVCTYA